VSTVRRAWLVLAGAVVTTVAGGVAFASTQHVSVFDGVYWAVTTATTVGYGDYTPHGVSGQLIAMAVMLVDIPALAACFALITSEHLVTRGVRWWADHGIAHVRREADAANTVLHDALHARLDDLHSVLDELRQQTGNGLLDSVEQRVDELGSALHGRLDHIEAAVARDNGPEHP